MKPTESKISLPVLVVGADAQTLDWLTDVFGKDLKSVPSWMEAIGEAAGGRYGLILGSLGAGNEESILAVGAVRSVNSKARIVLYCRPIQEPLARKALAVGADDYLIEPLNRQDLMPALNGQLTGSVVVAEVLSQPELRQETKLPATEVITGLSDSYSLCAELLQAGRGGTEHLLGQAQKILAEHFAVQWVQLQVVDESATADRVKGAQVEHSVPLAAGGQLLLSLGPKLAKRTGPAQPEQTLVQIGQMLGSLVDVGREMTALQKLAITDELTGLYNRRYVYEFTEQVLNKAHHDRFEVTVLLFDVDDFKHYNDNYGHATGDEVLKETSELMRRCSREHDLVGRFGGDEFVMIFWDAEQRRQPNSRHPQTAFALSERFRHEVSTHDYKCLGPKARGTLTISGGLASFPWDASTADGLFARADDALLKAKASGKNRIYIVGRELKP